MSLRSLLVFLSWFFYLTAVSGSTDSSEVAEEDYTTHVDYDSLYWCHSPRLTNGEATCHSPRGRAYRTTQGTRCNMRCDRGYRLSGSSSIQCMADRRWSGTSMCRKIRCPVLPLIPHGRYTCTQGFVVDSRCDFTCSPGHRIEGEHSRTCQHGGAWSGAQPICSDTEPPKIKCPRSRIKFADPGKLTARVSWDAPLATDTADKVLDVILVGQQPDSDFSEGANVIRYKVFDQARNRAACKFIIRVEVRRCPALPPPLHGSLACSSDLTNHGATCEYHCDGGYERGGVSSRRCQFDRSWSDEAAQCVAMAIKSDVKTASALLAQLFQKRRLLIVSAPDITDADYEMQNFMIQKSQCGLELRHVTLMQLLGSPPNHTGHIQEDYFTEQVVHQLRQTFRISTSYFSMVLVDKQGLDRERFIIPMSSEELFSYIDSFELDEEEREKLELHKHLCD
ncbi:sushi repeat-containing protein SRPX2 isoform X1 [Nerophis lumbriciformis]|uniref:sushi repeat-containing protein SRPX2 isoform X1 n=1 Tax=Nerophis lumbriciformis TaxID=546530 RepID=UPI002ADFB76F|nr:sushi repeat-containing protein SRPX2-like isoform X1 [Nerophis lumbriciformis]